MSGERDLDRLIASMEPVLHPDTFVFATCANALHEGIRPLMTFQEAEGITLICTRAEAEGTDIKWDYPCRMITLNIHSSLEAVGFLARITTALAAEGLSVNPVSAFFHDHLFVPEDRVGEAMTILARLSQEAR